jgi:tetratricopeptide (TPR) repeat protein
VRGEADAPRHSARRAIHILLLVVAGAIVFANTLHNELHLDDVYRVEKNHEIERFWPPWRHLTDPRTSSALPQIVQYRPLLPLSLSVGEVLRKPFGIERLPAFHLGNLALHLLTSVLLYLLFVELLARWSDVPSPDDSAFVAALLFTVHPVSGIPVNYVCARDLLMMMSFLVGALLVYARMRPRDTIAGWAAAATLLGLSMLSKQNGVVAPVLVLAFEVLVLGSPLRAPGTWLRPLAFAAVVASFFIWTEIGLGFSDLGQLETSAWSHWIYACTMLKVHVFHYLRNAVWPFQMRPLPYVEPAAGLAEPAVIAGAVVVFGSVAFALAVRRKLPLVSWCVVAYWVLFAPTSSIRPFRYLATDYRQYPSLAFLSLAVVLVASRLPQRLRVGLALVLVAYFAASSITMNRVWSSGEELWGQSVRYGTTAQGHLNYARSLEIRDPDTAQRHYLEALRLNPGNAYAHVNLGLLHVRGGRGEVGLEYFRRAVAMVPDWAMVHYYFSRAYEMLDRPRDALAELRIAADLDPRNVEYQYETAYELQQTGDIAGSLPYLERLERTTDGYRLSAFLHGYVLQEQGRWPESEAKYRAFLERNPDHFQARFNLAHGLMKEGRHREAIEGFHEVLRIDPDYASAHHWLALSYEAIGETALASRHANLFAAARRQ